MAEVLDDDWRGQYFQRRETGRSSLPASTQWKNVLHFDRNSGVAAAKASTVGNPKAPHLMHYKTGEEEKVRLPEVRGTGEERTLVERVVAGTDAARKRKTGDQTAK